MTASSDERNPVEVLAEEFLDRKRHGETPSLREYIERYPDLANEIRDLFPALLMMEDLGEGSGGSTESLAGDGAVTVAPRLQRLGDYRILSQIGRGGMGVVYEAEQESLGRRVALKVLSAGALSDPQQVRRFEREARAAARLHHTNIVPVFGVGQQNGHHYYVMQFIAGLGLDLVLHDLRRLRHSKASPEVPPAPEPARQNGLEPVDVQAARSRLRLTAGDVARSLVTGQFAEDEPIPVGKTVTEAGSARPAVAAEDRSRADSSSVVQPGSSDLSALSDSDRRYYQGIARIGVQVAEALDYANRQGVLHRDIKPSNLLLDNRGNVWVADFGLAKTAEAEDLTRTGDILGTIRYMAPERFERTCDARSDVYSLGLTLYELVALRPAYQAADQHSLIERVLHEQPARLKKVAPTVPRDLDTIIAKAMAREPAARYATAAALAEDLRRFVEDRPIRARRVSSAERFWRWCKRNPSLAGLSTALLLSLVSGTVVALVFAARATREAGRANNLANERAKSLRESNLRVADLDYERGQDACEKGELGLGMLRLVQSWRSAVAAGDKGTPWQRSARIGLSAWQRDYPKLQAVFSHASKVTSVAFSSDGRTVITGSEDGTARLWDAVTGQPIGEPLKHERQVMAVVFSPDGKTVITGCLDNNAYLWDVSTGRSLGRTLRHRDGVLAVAFSPDGKTVLTGSGSHDGTAQLWDAATGQPIGQTLKHAANFRTVAFAPDGKTVITGHFDGEVLRWDASTGQPLGELLTLGGSVRAVAFSPDGKTMITGSADARRWDASTGQPIGEPLKHEGAWAVAFSPNGETVITGGTDGWARFWDAKTGQPIGRALMHQGWVRGVAFSPDGETVITGSHDGTARVWAAVARPPLGHLLLQHQGMVREVAFSPDGKIVITG
ncbi:MAG TPA: serine/threonine-protein kinase, partial [Isosphaeraceae bacterium]|nr:serine/threonine-protein kinase [Isosphaeraceae bacterium]